MSQEELENVMPNCPKCHLPLDYKDGVYFCPKCSKLKNEGKELYEEALFDPNEYKTDK